MISNNFSGASIGVVAQFDGGIGGQLKEETVCTRLPVEFLDRMETLMRHAGMNRAQYLRAAILLFDKFAPDPSKIYTPYEDLRFLIANDPKVVDALRERYSV